MVSGYKSRIGLHASWRLNAHSSKLAYFSTFTPFQNAT
jgi:hypothetical protein